jgi:ribose transport system substrate-binding protein
MTASRIVRAALLAAALALGVSACGQDHPSTSTTKASGTTSAASATNGLKVGYSTLGSDEFETIMQNQVVDQIKKEGMTALEPVSANLDAGKQLADIRSLVSAGAQTIMVVPTDSSAIKPALDFLDSEKIPTVAIDIAPVGAKVSMIVRADNVKMGQDACQQMGAWLKGKGTVLSMQGDYRTSNGKDRGEGFKKCMGEKFPGIEVIERPTYWRADKAADIANTVLKTNKQIDGVYMPADTVMLAPVLSALKSAGRDAKVGQPGHVYLIAINGSPFGLEQIRAGKLDAELSQPLDLYARYGVSYLKDAVEGKTFKAGSTDHGSRIATTVDGNPEDLLPAPLVTKANVDDASLWGNNVK